MTKKRILVALPWIIIALPAMWQIAKVATAIAGRIAYPYDLEWMEGGMLHHAMRIRDGQGIYSPPSIDFIPYLYTPLYPALLAMFSGVFGLSYFVGRVVSVLSLIGCAANALFHLNSRRHEHAEYAPAFAGSVLAIGLFCAAYPYMEGWYDLVRADTLFLYIVTAAIAGLPRWAALGEGARGHARVAAGAAMLALAFFCKQTGILYVAFGGAIVLVVAWRRLLTYIVVAGGIGLGGTYVLQRATDGWFWTYIREIHAAHDFNTDRFVLSFKNILWHFPALTIVVGVTLLAVIITRIVRGTLPHGTHAFLLWTSAFALSTLVGAIGWGTEFAHFNAYMPAFLHGGLAAGAALPALAAIARVWSTDRLPEARIPWITHGVAGLAGLALSFACFTTKWNPKRFIPTDADREAGAKLVERIRDLPGEVWMPSHPWYIALAGKRPHVHRMGIKDVTHRQQRTVAGLQEALEKREFSAIVLDDKDINQELPQLAQTYRPAFKLPADERPRVFTGAPVTPTTIWVPALVASPPPGMRTLFDFEAVSWDGWKTHGAAWGGRPADEAAPIQGVVAGVTGRRFANSASNGDKSTGDVVSPEFTLEGNVIVHLGGTANHELRIELRAGTEIIAVASPRQFAGDALRPATLVVPTKYLGQRGTLTLVDNSPTGHLAVDDVWIQPNPDAPPPAPPTETPTLSVPPEGYVPPDAGSD